MPPKKNDRERRVQDRVEVELDIDLERYGKYYISKLTNVSIGGAFVRTREVYPVGTELKLRFKLPGEEKLIETMGNVVWVYTQAGYKEPNSSGMGIQFTDIKDIDRKRIAEFIATSMTP